MNNILYLLEFYTEVIFKVLIIGHSLFLFLVPIFKKKFKNGNRKILFPEIEDKTILIMGIIYIVLFLIISIYRLTTTNLNGINYKERMFGQYAFAYWMFPSIALAIIIIRQMNFKWKAILLYAFAFLALLPMEKIAITMAIHNDYLPSSVGHNYGLSIWKIWMPIVRNYLICLLIYFVSIELIFRIKVCKWKFLQNSKQH